MALYRPFTDACGNQFAAAHFRAVQINISAADQAVTLIFYGYKDLDAFTSGKQPLPGGMKVYSIAGAEFRALAAAAPVGATLYDVLAHAAEDYALHKEDTEHVDEQGAKRQVSYFADAIRD